jgi:hypothetical protein
MSKETQRQRTWQKAEEEIEEEAGCRSGQQHLGYLVCNGIIQDLPGIS